MVRGSVVLIGIILLAVGFMFLTPVIGIGLPFELPVIGPEFMGIPAIGIGLTIIGLLVMVQGFRMF